MLIRSELCIVDLEKVKNNLHFRSVSNSIISPPPPLHVWDDTDSDGA